MKPNFNEEKILWQEGFECVVGLDEAGRGPLAGPVVAAAVLVLPEHLFSKKISARPSAKIFDKNFGIRDSKKISEKKRDYFYKVLTKRRDIQWGIGIIPEKIIDEINIFEATKLAMQKALKKVQEKTKGKIDYLILDGNFRIKSCIPQKPIVKADEKVFSCVAAGIIAKVTRDKIMKELHKKYPEYKFDVHKGYGTKLHMSLLKKYGPCAIHRKSFRPVAEVL